MEGKLGGFRDFSSFDATRANLHALRPTFGKLDPNRLKIRIKPAPGAVIRMRDIVAELGSFIADFATFGHDFYDTSRALLKFPAHHGLGYGAMLKQTL